MGELHIKFVRTRCSIVDYLGSLIGYELKVQALYHGKSSTRIVLNDELKYHMDAEAYIDKCFREIEMFITSETLQGLQSSGSWAAYKDGGRKMLQTALMPEYKL